MDIDTLRTFCAIAEHLSISRAASAGLVSQAAVSQQLHKLERRLGVVLVDRSRRPIALTAAGKVFAAGCERVVRDWERLLSQMAELAEQPRGEVRVAAIYTVAHYVLGELVERFLAEHPHVTVRVEVMRTSRIYQAVREGQADVGFVAYPTPERGIEVRLWHEEPMVLVVRNDDELAAMETVPVEMLNLRSFVAFDRDVPTRKAIDAFLRSGHVTVNVVMELDNVETIKQAVRAGVGLAIVPRRVAAAEEAAGRLAVKDFEDRRLVRPIGWIRRRSAAASRAVLLFVRLLESTFPAR